MLGMANDGSDNPVDLDKVQRLVPQEAPFFATPEVPAEPEGESAPEAAVAPQDASAPEEILPEPQGPALGMSQAILDEYDYERLKRGDIRKGIVLSLGANEIVVDIGAKRECIVAASDLQKLGDEAAGICEGNEIPVYIVKPEDREGHLVGSLYMAKLEDDWAHAEACEQSGEVFEAKVSGQNRGGLLVPFGRLRGFVPASHLVGPAGEGEERPQSLNNWIGKTLPFKVIEVNRRRNRLILSYRAARRQWRAQQKQSLLDNLTEGSIQHGIISSLASFGAFVDLGGADGLIHISEMAWYRVEHPSELLQVGQEVEVYVLRVEGERGRIGLSLKRLQPDPWGLVESKYTPGQLVEGKISKLADFGAFAEIEKGVEGLIHLTEMADPAPARPEDAVQPGEVHLLRVLRVDSQNRRVGLSMRAVEPQELEAWQTQRATPEAGQTAVAADGAQGDEPADA